MGMRRERTMTLELAVVQQSLVVAKLRTEAAREELRKAKAEADQAELVLAATRKHIEQQEKNLELPKWKT